MIKICWKCNFGLPIQKKCIVVSMNLLLERNFIEMNNVRTQQIRFGTTKTFFCWIWTDGGRIWRNRTSWHWFDWRYNKSLNTINIFLSCKRINGRWIWMDRRKWQRSDYSILTLVWDKRWDLRSCIIKVSKLGQTKWVNPIILNTKKLRDMINITIDIFISTRWWDTIVMAIEFEI